MERAQGRARKTELPSGCSVLASRLINAIGTDSPNQGSSDFDQVISLDGESVATQTNTYTDDSIKPVELQSLSYPHTNKLKQLESCRPACAPDSVIPLDACPIVTPLVPQEDELCLHPDREFCSYIVSGIANGFHIGYQYQGTTRVSATSNMMSAERYPGAVQEYLATERSAVRVAGPFKPREVESVHVSRFGVIPKGSRVGEWRLILDLSFAPGLSVNDGINLQWCSLQYPTIDQAVQRMLQFPPGALLAKVDVAHAFRNILVHPEDRHLLAMEWDGKIFIDLCLPFGLRSSPMLFTSVADALEWIMLRWGVSWSIH